MSDNPKYSDPVVAYNTGYNDGAREERERILKAISVIDATDKPMCPFCNGTRRVRWGVSTRLGGEMGPCLCTQEGKKAFGR